MTSLYYSKEKSVQKSNIVPVRSLSILLLIDIASTTSQGEYDGLDARGQHPKLSIAVWTVPPQNLLTISLEFPLCVHTGKNIILRAVQEMFDTSQDIHSHIPLTYPNTHKHTKLYMHIYKYI